jgi:hypothetical protein
MFAIYAEMVKRWIVQIHRNPELLSDGKIADAIVKHAGILKKLDTRGSTRARPWVYLKLPANAGGNPAGTESAA